MGRSISVVIPTYNGSAFIGEALESVFAQTLPPQKIIVVDDASTDGTADLVASVARYAPIPLRLIRLRKNSGGPARPINVGVGEAAGEFIAICDQDDLLLPDKLEEQARVLDRSPRVTFVFSLAGRHGEPGRTFQHGSLVSLLNRSGQQKAGFRQFDGLLALRLLMEFGNITVGYPGFLFRRSVWERRGGVEERLKIGSDYDFVSWMCTQGDVGFIDQVHYLRRVHEENLSLRDFGAALDTFRVQSKYLAQQRWILHDRALSQKLNDAFFGFGYWAREKGFYPEAVICHWLSMRIWRWDPRGFLAVCKLFPHWLHRNLSRRKGVGGCLFR